MLLFKNFLSILLASWPECGRKQFSSWHIFNSVCIYKWVSFTLCRTFHTEVWQHPPPPTCYMDAASLLPHWLQRRWNDDLQISDRVQPLAIRKARTHARAHTHTAHWFRRLCGFIRTRWTNKECLRLLMRPLECGLRSLYNGNGADRLWPKS